MITTDGEMTVIKWTEMIPEMSTDETTEETTEVKIVKKIGKLTCSGTKIRILEPSIQAIKIPKFVMDIIMKTECTTIGTMNSEITILSILMARKMRTTQETISVTIEFNKILGITTNTLDRIMITDKEITGIPKERKKDVVKIREIMILGIRMMLDHMIREITNREIMTLEIMTLEIMTLETTILEPATRETTIPGTMTPGTMNPKILTPEITKRDTTNPDTKNRDTKNPDTKNPGKMNTEINKNLDRGITSPVITSQDNTRIPILILATKIHPTNVNANIQVPPSHRLLDDNIKTRRLTTHQTHGKMKTQNHRILLNTYHRYP